MEFYKASLLLPLLLIVCTVPAIAGSCSSSYDYCYQDRKVEDSGGQADADAFAKIEINLDPRTAQGDYLLKDGYYHYKQSYDLLYKCTGRKIYYVDNTQYSGDLVNSVNKCSEDGCPFTQLASKSGTRIITGDQKSFGLICWDYEFDEGLDDNSWAWAWTAVIYKFDYNIRTVSCFKDSQCTGTNAYCDISGTWNNWGCKVDLCKGIICDNKCYGTDTILKDGHCEGGQCKYDTKEACTDNNDYTVDTCEEMEIQANDNYKFVLFSITGTDLDTTKTQAYCTSGEQLECISDSDCDDKDKLTIIDWCENGKCRHTNPVGCVESSDCNVEEECKEYYCVEKTGGIPIFDEVIEIITGEPSTTNIETTVESGIIDKFSSFEVGLGIAGIMVLVGAIILTIFIIRRRK